MQAFRASEGNGLVTQLAWKVDRYELIIGPCLSSAETADFGMRALRRLESRTDICYVMQQTTLLCEVGLSVAHTEVP